MSSDPLADAWGLAQVDEHMWEMTDRPRPEMLYLDKCWELLQRFCHWESGSPRPAHELFRGQVTFTDEGWEPHMAVLSPETVKRIADDLDSVTPQELDTFCGALATHDGDYYLTFFGQSQTFAREMATRGLGVVYMIG